LALDLAVYPVALLVFIGTKLKPALSIEAVLGKLALVELSTKLHETLTLIVSVFPLADIYQTILLVEADPWPVNLTSLRVFVAIVEHFLVIYNELNDLSHKN
jgi:hypothetical protein